MSTGRSSEDQALPPDPLNHHINNESPSSCWNKPHVYHWNLPSHFLDPTDQIPLVTKFGNTKVQQLIDLIFSIQLTESMFVHTYNDDGENENDAEGVTTTTLPLAATSTVVSKITKGITEVGEVDDDDDDDDDDEEDVEPVVPFGDTDVTIPTTTLLSVCKRCSRIVALLSTIESLKCTIPSQDHADCVAPVAVGDDDHHL